MENLAGFGKKVMVGPEFISLRTQGFSDIIDITSHVAAIAGPSLTVPITGGALALGTWQQIVFIDFDNRQGPGKILGQLRGE